MTPRAPLQHSVVDRARAVNSEPQARLGHLHGVVLTAEPRFPCWPWYPGGFGGRPHTPAGPRRSFRRETLEELPVL